jgi:hypothetical protein
MHKKRNRLIAALLTFAMCLGVISPLSAFAEETAHDASNESAVTNVASIGSNEYATLAEAVTAAKSGTTTDAQTIKLLKCATLNETLTIDGDTVILDLDGHTLTGANNAYAVTVCGTADVTVKGGTITGTKAICATGSATLKVNNDVTVESSVYAVAVGSTANVTIDGATIKVTDSSAIGILTGGDDTVNDAPTLTVKGGTITSAFIGVKTQAKTTATITNTTINAKYGVVTIASSDVTLDEVTIGDKSEQNTITTANGIEAYATSQVTITDSTINASTNGVYTTGNAKATLTNVKINETSNATENATTVNRGIAAWSASEVTVENSTIDNAIQFAILAANTTKVTVIGGTLTSSDVGAKAQQSAELTIDGTKINASTKGVVAIGNTKADLTNVTIGEKTTDGDTETDTTKTGVGVEGQAVVTITDSKITTSGSGAYANGSPSSSNPAKLTIENTTITTSGAKANAVEVSYYAECVVNGANTSISGYDGILVWGYTDDEIKTNSGWTEKGPKLTINNGTIMGTNVAVSGNGLHHYTSITINDGNITGIGKALGIYHPQIGDLNINGGTITGSGAAVAIKVGTLTMTDGTLIATAEDADPGHNSNGIESAGAALQIESNKDYQVPTKINISGGTLESKKGYAIFEYLDTATNESKVTQFTITGGVFKSNTEQGTHTHTTGEEGSTCTYVTGEKESSIALCDETKAKLLGNELEGDGIIGGTFSAAPTAYLDTATYTAEKDGDNYTVQRTGVVKLTENTSVSSLDAPNNKYDLQGYTLTYTSTKAITDDLIIVDTKDTTSGGTKGTLALEKSTAKIAPADGKTADISDVTVTGGVYVFAPADGGTVNLTDATVTTSSTALNATTGTINVNGATTINGKVTGTSDTLSIADGATFSQDPSAFIGDEQCVVASGNNYVVYDKIALTWADTTLPSVTKSASFASTMSVTVTTSGEGATCPQLEVDESALKEKGLTDEQITTVKNAAATYVNAVNAKLKEATWQANFGEGTDYKDGTVSILPSNTDVTTWLKSNLTDKSQIDRFPISGTPKANVSVLGVPTVTTSKALEDGVLYMTYGDVVTLSASLPADYMGATLTVTASDASGILEVATNNGSITAVGAQADDAEPLTVTATFSIDNDTTKTATQTIKVKVAKQDVDVTVAGNENTTIEGTATVEKLTTAGVTVTAKGANDGAAVEGTWELVDVKETLTNAETGTYSGSATVKFTPSSTNNLDTKYNANSEQKITWTSTYTLLKLVVDSGTLDKTDETYAGATFKLVKNGETGDALTESTVASVNETLAGFGTAKEWAVASDGSLYPTFDKEDTNYDTYKNITNPTSWVAYINSRLTDGYKLVAAYNPKQTDATVSTTNDPIYTQKNNEVADKADIKLGDEDDTAAGTTTKENLMKDIMDALQVTNDDTIPSGGTTTDSDAAETVQKSKVVASAVYDVTYKDEEGNPKVNNFDGGSLEIYLPYPETQSGEEGTVTNWEDYNIVVAHVVTHDKTSPNYGKIEYLTPSRRGTNGVYVNVTSLSTFALLAVDGEVTLPSTATEATPSEDTAAVAPAAKSDDSGAIILAGAVVATVVVGGIIYYNWDKLPVHKIEGTVVDTNGAAVANATVTLAKDGKVVKTVTTDANGYYSAKVAKGDYTITVTVGEASATAEGSTGASAQLAIA